MMIVNNTCEDIEIIKPYLYDYAETGVLDDDISDIFEVKKIIVNGETRLIVDFL